MDDHDDTLLPSLGQAGAQARAGRQMLEALEILNQQLGLRLAAYELAPDGDNTGPSIAHLVHTLSEAGPEIDDDRAPALFSLHTIDELDLHRAAATAYAELPAGEAIFARRQWRVLLRVITAIDAGNPDLGGGVYAYAATRAFAEYRIGGGAPLEDGKRKCAEAIAVLLRYVHNFFRLSNPGLGEAAYTLAPLAFVEHLRQMFPAARQQKAPPEHDPVSPPGGAPVAIH